MSALASEADTGSMRCPVPITVARPVPVTAERASERVQQEAFRLIDGFLREVFELQIGRPARHLGRDSFFRGDNRFR
jgi:hypothetical protein